MPLSLRWRLTLSHIVIFSPGTWRSNCCPKMMWCWPTFSLAVLGRAKRKQSQHTKTGRITLNETIASKSAKMKPRYSYRQNRQSDGMHRYVKSCALNFAELSIISEIYNLVAAADCVDLASPSFCTFHFFSLLLQVGQSCDKVSCKWLLCIVIIMLTAHVLKPLLHFISCHVIVLFFHTGKQSRLAGECTTTNVVDHHGQGSCH